MIKRGRYVAMALIVTTLSLHAQKDMLTIDHSIELALKHSPDIEIGRLDFKGALQRSKFQKGYYLPRLDLSAVAGKQGLEYSDQPALSGNALLGSISASQLLYDFGKTKGRVNSANSEADAYKATMNQFISQKILSIKTRYYNALKMRSIIDVSKKNIKLQEGQLKRATRYYESGIKTIIDVSDSQVKLIQAQLDLSNAGYELKLRMALLEESMGFVPYGGKYKLQHEELDLPNISHSLPYVNTSMAPLEGFAYDHRFELQSSKYLVESSQATVESQKGEYYPTLSLKGDYTAQSVDNEFAAMTPDRQWQAGVDLKWNLFAGQQTDASVEESKISSMRAASKVEEIRLTIKREVVESSLSIMRTKDAVKLSESIAKASEKKFEQAQKRYENELSDYIELQEAQQGYISSLGNLAVAYYDYFIAIAQLDYAVGR